MYWAIYRLKNSNGVRTFSSLRTVTTEPAVKPQLRRTQLYFHVQHHVKGGTIGHVIYAAQCHDF